MRIIVWNEPKSKYWKFLGIHITHGTHFLDLLAKVLGRGEKYTRNPASSPGCFNAAGGSGQGGITCTRSSHGDIVPAWHKLNLALLTTVRSPLPCFRSCTGQCKTKQYRSKPCVCLKAEPHVLQESPMAQVFAHNSYRFIPGTWKSWTELSFSHYFLLLSSLVSCSLQQEVAAGTCNKSSFIICPLKKKVSKTQDP